MFEIELFICIKMDSALNNLQWLICHKTQRTNQPIGITVLNVFRVHFFHFYLFMFSFSLDSDQNLYIYIYIYIYMCIHICVCVCVFMYVHICVYVCVHVYEVCLKCNRIFLNLFPSVPIIHRFGQVFQATSCVRTETL